MLVMNMVNMVNGARLVSVDIEHMKRADTSNPLTLMMMKNARGMGVYGNCNW